SRGVPGPGRAARLGGERARVRVAGALGGGAGPPRRGAGRADARALTRFVRDPGPAVGGSLRSATGRATPSPAPRRTSARRSSDSPPPFGGPLSGPRLGSFFWARPIRTPFLSK